MPAKEEPLIHSYKISTDRRWDLFNAHALVQSLLGYRPERWHLEKHSRRKVDLLGNPVTYTWYLIHAKHNGRWRFRYTSKEKAERLINLNITKAHIQHADN
jgi:hypothetical protein